MRRDDPPAAGPAPGTIDQAFALARAELGIREDFPADVLREAEDAAARGPVEAEREDLTAVEFVTVDPPGSRDLDQALHIARDGDGYLVSYAIADVGAFVPRGGAVEREAWLRGLTFYAPDRRVALYPPAISEGAASLLPDGPRPAIVFRIALGRDGGVRSSRVGPALVRSRAQLTYEGVAAHVLEGAPIAHTGGETLALLREVGERRKAAEVARGGVSIPLVDQHVQKEAAERLGYRLEYERPNAAEDWNAQISLLAGHVAAETMLAAGAGLLRVMPPPEPQALERLRAAAATLGVPWPRGTSYPDFIRGIDPAQPRATALLWQARRTLRGADYVAFRGDPPPLRRHAALAMEYAHTTAPLRRLADRYVLDLLVALDAGRPVSDAEHDVLARLPALMDEAERKSGKLERRVVDVAEAWTLQGREGERFAAAVLGARGNDVEVQIEEPPVRVSVPAGAAEPAPGSAVTVVLERADVRTGTLRFALAR
jgi:exoribonuclease R